MAEQKTSKTDTDTDPESEISDTSEIRNDQLAGETTAPSSAEPAAGAEDVESVPGPATADTAHPDLGADIDDADIDTDTSRTAAFSEPKPAPPVHRVVEKRGGFGMALFGGFLAAAIGFAAARVEILDQYLPEALKSDANADAIAALETGLAEQSTDLEALRGQVSAIAVPDLAPLQSRLAGLEDRIAPITARTEAMSGQIQTLSEQIQRISDRFAELDGRLGEVEKQPISESVSEAAIAAYERELAALEQAVMAQRAEVEGLLAEARASKTQARALEREAADAAELAANRDALAQLRAAIDSGAPYSKPLAVLNQAGMPIPAELTVSAPEGVATLAALRDAFPPAARGALAAARAKNDGSGGGLRGFLQRQLGARSIRPREGNDPDAILSRAEAALIAGDLERALEEVSALPPAARSVLGNWTELAKARLAVVAAVAGIAQNLNNTN